MSDKSFLSTLHFKVVQTELPQNQRKFSYFKIASYILILLVLTCFSLYSYLKVLNEPPSGFPLHEQIIIESGDEIRTITKKLEAASVVKSDWLLYYALVLFYEPSTVKASTYVFSKPVTTFEIAQRLTEGDFGNDLVRFTHFEGEPVTKIALRASEILPDFNTDLFLSLALEKEGRLFPDTYLIPRTYSESELFELLLKTYNERVHSIYFEQTSTQHELTEDEILILASIVEREANTTESMAMVASILLNRLRVGMPLQADASIEYILDKPLSELTPDDLKIDSPYNTYLHNGLPPTPIGNPGFAAIKAVIESTPNDYYYYITDPDGQFHYAKTYDEHLRNIERYLR